MVRVEESSHGIQQIFVPVQVLLLLNQLQLESCPHWLILQWMVVLNVVNQFLKEISTIVDLKECCILLLIWIYTSNLMLHGAVLVVILLLRVEQITSRWLHLLIELKHFDDVSLLAVARSPMMVLLLAIFAALLVTKEIILGLIWINAIFVSLVLMTTWKSILIDGTHTRMLLIRLILCIRHDNLDGLQILGTCPNTLNQLQILALHVLMSFG